MTVDASTWSPSDPAPVGYHIEKGSHSGFIAGGATMFGVSYGLSVATGALAQAVISGANASHSAEWGCTPNCSTSAADVFFIPVVGPFVLAGSAAQGPQGAPLTAIALTDGLLQAGGLAMLIYGLAAPAPPVLVKDRPAKSAGFTFTPAPVVGNGRAGMGLVGTF